jgi:hypothetical protein
MVTTLPIKNLHLEYKLWIAELNFDNEMINIFESHLENIILQNPAKKDLLPQVEHFQNQFIRQREVIDDLKHHLNLSERQLASFTREMSPIGYEFERLDNHPHLRDQFLTFRKIFNELKEEFHDFEAQCM